MNRQPKNILAAYNINRKAASRLLKVSIRTVDRYITQKKLLSRIVNGRILLSKSEIIALKESRQVDSSVDTKMSIDNMVEKPVDNVDDMSTLMSTFMSTPTQKDEENLFKTYKRLYEEVYEELKDKQGKLEGANYRVGQLEAQVRYSVPLIEHQRETTRLLGASEAIKTEVEKSKLEAKRLMEEISLERLNKRIYLIILFILLILQPLWLFLR